MIKFERLRAVGSLVKERVQAVPLRGSIIFITTAGVPLTQTGKTVQIHRANSLSTRHYVYAYVYVYVWADGVRAVSIGFGA